MPTQQEYEDINELDEGGPEGSPRGEPKKMNGAGFMMILMLAAFKDFSDIFLNIGVLSSIFTTITGLFVSGIIWFYLFYSGVSFSDKKLTTLIATAIISVFPFLSILPETTLGLLLIRNIEHSERLQRISKLAVMPRGK